MVVFSKLETKNNWKRISWNSNDQRKLIRQVNEELRCSDTSDMIPFNINVKILEQSAASREGNVKPGHE